MAGQRNRGGSSSIPPGPGPRRLDLGRGLERAARSQLRARDGGAGRGRDMTAKGAEWRRGKYWSGETTGRRA
jgi:hypothetical protein